MTGRVKRSCYVFFWIEDGPQFDVTEFLRGKLKSSLRPRLFALSLLSESKRALTIEEVRFLSELPSDHWSEAAFLDFEDEHLETLARRGLLLSDSDDAELARFRRRDEFLTSHSWHPYAAFYHFMTRERELNAGLPGSKVPDTEHLAESAEDNAAKFTERFGAPPKSFHRSANASRTIDLPLVENPGALYQVLRRRRTTRAFESSEPVKLRDFTTLLRYAFGCYGLVRPSPEVELLHKTSPSGGSLHPIEAYPLVLNVESLASGLYHYDVRNHSLELIQQLELTEARDLAKDLSRGQSHAHSAHFLILMTARFGRCFWKYRQRSQAYGSLLMEIGHFSQTLYLVATELGLGIFFSAVIDGTLADEALGLQSEEEGALALCGCGILAQEGHDLGLDFEPFEPRSS